MSVIRSFSVLSVAILIAVVVPSAQTPAPSQSASIPKGFSVDANGNTLHKASNTGHFTNYDEAKASAYTLPDPLVMANGQPVRDAAGWKVRRAELIKLYEADVFGGVPANAPKVTWQVVNSDPKARDGAAFMKRLVGRIGTKPGGPSMNMSLYTPANATKPVPVILVLGAVPPVGSAEVPNAVDQPPVAADILRRGWGFASVGFQDIQPDRANAWNGGVIGQAFAAGQTQPGPGEWGTITAWTWGISRAIDYLETDKQVDAKRIAIHGCSRLGKAVLWASARDERVAAVWAACAGEMGTALARRDYGETIDDVTEVFPWWFTSTFQKYAGHWNDLPVDTHMMIALSAPRPVFISTGTTDLWADPKGEFLAAVAAGPVYRLLKKKDVGAAAIPPPDTPLTTGDIGFLLHTGGHGALPGDWRAFLNFLGKYFGE